MKGIEMNFENLHPNHKLAFLDGLLSGVAIALIGVAIYRDYKEAREAERLIDEEIAKDKAKTN